MQIQSSVDKINAYRACRGSIDACIKSQGDSRTISVAIIHVALLPQYI